jgi:hypothetical protein
MKLINKFILMASLTLTVNPFIELRQHKLSVELDAHQFERLAANFGFFNPDFIKSLDRSEADERAGRVKKIKSLSSLAK